MKRIRQTGLIFLVMLMLAGTTGFNIWHHVCACRPVTEAKTHSCCEGGAPAPATTDDACGTGCSHDHKGCKDIPVYFKASIIAVPAIQKTVLPELMQALVTELPFISGNEGEVLDYQFIISQDKPPPRAGKELVFYLHQLRIPFSA
jgi:hypothetical protein